MRRRLPEIAVLMASASILLSAYLYTSVQREGKNRRDQICKRDETAHLDEVKQLRQTYGYLLEAPRHDFLYVLVRRNLPQSEHKAIVDAAPAFCDEPGIGLDEPDPKIPCRPKSLGRGPKVRCVRLKT